MASDENETEDKKKSGSMIVTLATVAGLSVAAAGGGWLLGTVLAPQKKAVEQASHSEHGGAKGEESSGKELISTEANGVVLLRPLTTNLAYPSDTWIRLEVALLFRDKPDVETSEAIHQDFMAYLRTVSLQQVEGARGFQHLREDLEEQAELRSRGRVKSIMFRTFVIE